MLNGLKTIGKLVSEGVISFIMIINTYSCIAFFYPFFTVKFACLFCTAYISSAMKINKQRLFTFVVAFAVINIIFFA